MGPNIRVAMLISLSFIGSFAWLVHEVAPPLAAVSAPLIVGKSRSGPAAALVSRLTRGPVRFRTASAFERESRALANASPRLIVRDAARSPSMAGMTLPPLSAIALRWAKRTVAASEPSHATPEAAGRRAALAGDTPRHQVLVAAKTKPARPVAPAKAQVKPKRYVVQTGDSLWKIARSEWNSTDPALIRLLIQANPQLRNRDVIRAGWTLIIPPADGMAPPSSVLIAAVQPETNQIRWYTIRKNDSLARIARRELKNVRRWPEIVKLNKSLDARKPIHAGTRIRLPAT